MKSRCRCESGFVIGKKFFFGSLMNARCGLLRKTIIKFAGVRSLCFVDFFENNF